MRDAAEQCDKGVCEPWKRLLEAFVDGGTDGDALGCGGEPGFVAEPGSGGKEGKGRVDAVGDLCARNDVEVAGGGDGAAGAAGGGFQVGFVVDAWLGGGGTEAGGGWWFEKGASSVAAGTVEGGDVAVAVTFAVAVAGIIVVGYGVQGGFQDLTRGGRARIDQVECDKEGDKEGEPKDEA